MRERIMHMLENALIIISYYQYVFKKLIKVKLKKNRARLSDQKLWTDWTTTARPVLDISTIFLQSAELKNTSNTAIL